MTSFTTEDRLSAERDLIHVTDISQHFISIKRILKDLQLLTACPTSFDVEKLIELRAELINESFHISAFIDSMINKN